MDASGVFLFHGWMDLVLSTPATGDLTEVLRTLADWRREDTPMQLHPGDVGFHWQLGAQATADALRVWRRDGRIVAVGMIDGPDVVRLAVEPELHTDGELAQRMVDDLSQPDRGVLSTERVSVEAMWGGRFRELALDNGWEPDEPWVPLVRDLAEPVPAGTLRVERVGPDRVADRVAVQRGAFEGSKFTAERWHTMATGVGYRNARCIVGYDEHGHAVAAVTVWSAGKGRPGLLEPVGVHRDHRGHGYGTAIAVAAAAVLRDMGASSATVCTPLDNAAAVATYRSAGFSERPTVRDLRRPALDSVES